MHPHWQGKSACAAGALGQFPFNFRPGIPQCDDPVQNRLARFGVHIVVAEIACALKLVEIACSALEQLPAPRFRR